MSENCVVCGQPMPSRREQIAEMEKRMVAMTSVIAAAEERGRRAGIGEAAKECELRIASWTSLRDQPTVAARVDEAEALAEIIRCLAPRDSGKET